jgi:hypothetical protein
MRRSKTIQIDDIHACIYYLNGVTEVHYNCEKETYIKSAHKLLRYLDQEAFVTDEPIKLIPIVLIKEGKYE